MSQEEFTSVEKLIEQYALEGRAEFAQDAAREAEERARLEAAFEAGATLRVLKPLSIYDPIEGQAVEVRTDVVLEVASHEGDILLGRLADNEHSIGVLFEEDHRWYVRKYFLALCAQTEEHHARDRAHPT